MIVQVNPARAPEVVGALLDAEAPDDFVNNLILSVRSLIPVERLCAEVEKRNRLKLLSPFLEHLVSEGSQVPPRLLCYHVVSKFQPPKLLVFQVNDRLFAFHADICRCCVHSCFSCCRTHTCTTRWARSSSTHRTTRTTS